MVRLVVFIIIFVIFLGFIVLNLGNTCDISFGFKTFKDVPIFVSIFISFVFGLLASIPMIFSLRRSQKKSAPSQDFPSAMNAKKRGFLKKRKNIPKDEENSPRWQGADSTPGEIKKEDSSYGID